MVKRKHGNNDTKGIGEKNKGEICIYLVTISHSFHKKLVYVKFLYTFNIGEELLSGIVRSQKGSGSYFFPHIYIH